jgi:hypothetical protein
MGDFRRPKPAGAALVEGRCGTTQNGHGGTFYVVENANLAKSVTALLKGDRASP